MGKTRSTYRDQVDQFVDDWRQYRRALRRRHQPHWDEMMRGARRYADAGGQQNPRDPKWTIAFSIMLEQQRQIAELQAELEDDD
jgi:hypothetical protein